MKRGTIAVAGLLLSAAIALPASAAFARDRELPRMPVQDRSGNVIFFHPDGTAASHWAAARVYWYGPDANSPWDELPEMAIYRGHMSDILTATSNGGATVHAFGYKVQGPGSFGRDGGGDNAREILALSGYDGSVMREAANAGHPVGVVNDGDLAEPGTGVFLAEVGGRGDDTEIVLQMLEGRPGQNDQDPVVMLGGGERFFLPAGTPRCTSSVTLDCAVHIDPLTNAGPNRTDGRNLLREAVDDGWTVIRTRAEFEALQAQLLADPNLSPKVLGLFGADDIFNDVPEEVLTSRGLIDPSIPASDKRSNMILFGDRPGTLGYNPPTAAELHELALIILERRAAQVGKGFLLVTEVESTDNFGNSNNAIGTLTGLLHANQVIEASARFIERSPRTLLFTAADSDAGAMSVTTVARGNVGSVGTNSTGSSSQNVSNPLDGLYGRGTAAFIAEPDAFGQELPFGIAWAGGPDFGNAIVSRAAGLNANVLGEQFSAGFDNTDVYRLIYLGLFNRVLPSSLGQLAPSR